MCHHPNDQLIILLRLKHALQALALPPRVQLGLLPDFVCKADELALDFDHWCSTVVQREDWSLTEFQRSQLVALDGALTDMSSAEQRLLWTDDAMTDRPEWQHVRMLAQAALAAFGWTLETPPSYRHEYINSNGRAHDRP